MNDSLSIAPMGHQRSLHDRLQRLFKTGFTAIDIAEPLMLFDADARGLEVQGLMAEHNAHVAGISIQGLVSHYVAQES